MFMRLFFTSGETESHPQKWFSQLFPNFPTFPTPNDRSLLASKPAITDRGALRMQIFQLGAICGARNPRMKIPCVQDRDRAGFAQAAHAKRAP
jgi:hypothetical protein